MCERALCEMTEEDRDFVGLFLQVDLQAAHADAGLGRTDLALARVDGLLHRFAPSGHPLALGLLHEARAQIAFHAGDEATYAADLAEVERLFRATGTPTLISKIEQLAALRRPLHAPRSADRDAFIGPSLATELTQDQTKVEGPRG